MGNHQGASHELLALPSFLFFLARQHLNPPFDRQARSSGHDSIIERKQGHGRLKHCEERSTRKAKPLC
jgi:hypothetical protein